MPLVYTAFGLISVKPSLLQSLGAVFAGCGGAFLLSQLARDAGRKSEKALFAKWGGLPSVAIFRHRDTRLDSITKTRYHKKLATLIKGSKAPSAEQEHADPASADAVYSAWSTYLRVNTRDTRNTPCCSRRTSITAIAEIFGACDRPVLSPPDYVVRLPLVGFVIYIGFCART